MSRYDNAKEIYAAYGVDTDAAIKKLCAMSVSMHCWQGDDVAGFEHEDSKLTGGGIMVTGNHPGRARNIKELWADLDKAFSVIPGNHRVALQAFYGDYGGKFVDRNEIEPCHFQSWIDWTAERGLKLDFNSTFFSHPKSGNYTLSSADKGIRDFWIEHAKRVRRITSYVGEAQGSPSSHNLWIHDGEKEVPIDRHGPRMRLKESLDEIFSEKLPSIKDAMEQKLFGIGSEAYVVGSNEFYFGYAAHNNLMVCFDTGHFHPTESVSDKISPALLFTKGVLLHVSRPIRWDSDHVTVMDDHVKRLMKELVRTNSLDRVDICTDFFDGTINRVGAWVVGMRSILKALLLAFLEPVELLRKYENEGRNFERLAMQEETKSLPYAAVWERFCEINNVPAGSEWVDEIAAYGDKIAAERG
ncbi:MAG: L-rhamnose isomerase [Abditibacteriota bacterium]|nr:L-rhamnose isomerase [Abditibacteriota bacterium]